SAIVGAQGARTSAAKAAAEPAVDLIGRPVDLDLSRGVQAPYRDTSKLPTTFAGAAKTQPVDPQWGTRPYRPTSRRDFTGIWINQGGIGWTPGIPPAAGRIRRSRPRTPRSSRNIWPMPIAAGRPAIPRPHAFRQACRAS